MVRTWGAIRRRALPFGLAVALLGAVATVSFLQRSQAARPGSSAQRMILRLHDLPRGYIGNLVSGESGPLDVCDRLHPADAEPALVAFVDRFSPKGCYSIYLRLYRVPGPGPAPSTVGTGALDAGSIEAAEAGLAVAPEAIGHLTEWMDLEEVSPVATIGEATRLFHWKNGGNLFRHGRSVDTFLTWRSGSALGVIFVEGRSPAANDLAATELARRQQAHIEHSTPYTRAERDSTEVPLDNPILKVKAYWLDRKFEPGRGASPAKLRNTFAVGGRGVPRRQTLWLEYTRGILLREWTKAGWRRFKTAHPSARFPAVAHRGSTVVAVELRRCGKRCAAGSRPYASLGAAKGIARSLRPRRKPSY